MPPSKIPRTLPLEEGGVSQKLFHGYQLLLDIARDLASTLNLPELLQRIVNAAVELTDANAASILLYDQPQEVLHFEAASNLDESSRKGLKVPVDASIAGWIVKNRQPLIIEDTENDQRHFETIGQVVNLPTKSLLGVPLIAKEKVIGVLEVINKKYSTFTLEDQNLLITLAAQAANAIETSRLFQQSDLISELVHELRSPMTSLSTAAYLLLQPELTDDQRKRIVELIQGETERISGLATAFLDLSRMESGRAIFNIESIDLKEILADCLDILFMRSTEKELSVDVAIPSRLPVVEADQDKIKQVLINLISNAVKYNRLKGRIGLTVVADPKEIHISVSDTGVGIATQHLSHLFEKFYRVPGTEHIALGTGLGLAICKQIMDAHHGSIDVKSTLEVGTTFTIHLPIDRK